MSLQQRKEVKRKDANPMQHPEAEGVTHGRAYHYQVIRVRNLGKLKEACGDVERLAEFLMLPIKRVRELVEGERNIANDLAMHIEMQAGLPEGWLDRPDAVLPAEVARRARGEEPVVEAAPEAEEAVDRGEGAAPVGRKRMGRPFTVSWDVAEARREALRQALDAMGKGSRVELAKRIRTDISVISSWLAGRRRITDNWAVRIAEALPGVDMCLAPKAAKEAPKPVPEAPKAESADRGAARPTVVSMPAHGGLSVDTLRAMVADLVQAERDERKLAKVLLDLLD